MIQSLYDKYICPHLIDFIMSRTPFPKQRNKIIPNAEIKFFIDARIEIRAKRRQKQLNLENESYKKILKKMIKRDKQDIERLESPLVRTKDSHLIDTSKISENEAFQIAINYIKKKTDFI